MTDALLTKLSYTNKRVDQFRVTFYNLPDQISNILGNQIKSITRPNVRFETGKLNHRASQRTVTHQVRFSPSTMVFYDDENSVVSMFLYAQMFRQKHMLSDAVGRQGNDRSFDFRFSVKIEILNPVGEVVESFKMMDCVINEIEHSVPVVADDEENEITATVEYDDVDFDVFERYQEMIKELNDAIT